MAYRLDEEFSIVPQERLVFESYSRPRLINQLKKLRPWHGDAVGAISVARVIERLEIELWAIIDGGHRVTEAWAEGIETLPACVHEDKDFLARAELFGQMNEQTKLDALGRFRVEFERGSGFATDTLEVVKEKGSWIYGFPHPERGMRSSKSDIQAVGTLMKICRFHGKSGLAAVLDVTSTWMPGEAPKLDTLAGLNHALHVAKISDEKRAALVERLRSDGWTQKQVGQLVVLSDTDVSGSRGQGGAEVKWSRAFRQIAEGNAAPVDLDEALKARLKARIRSKGRRGNGNGASASASATLR